MFDYLLYMDDLEVDIADNHGRTPLLYTVSERFHEYFALELIKKGANIHLRDCNGSTLLHMAAKRPFDDNLRLGQLLIEKGLDIDAQDNDGITPLYQACASGNVEWIHMLLHYGACATVSSDRGILPLAVLSPNISLEHNHLADILFDHTFDGGKVEVQLATLVASMRLESTIFCRILNLASNVSYDISGLQYLKESLAHLKPKHLRWFLVKCGHIVKQLIEDFDSFVRLIETPTTIHTKEVFNILLESNYISDYIQGATLKHLISHLIKKSHRGRPTFNKEEVTKIVCTMLTYGLHVTSTDLETLFAYYGCCDLFRLLLHMEIEIDTIHYSSMAVFYYKPNITIEDVSMNLSASAQLLDYFNHPKLKQLCSGSTIKANTLPSVPRLVELSRNVARKYIVTRYNVKNSMQFYTILNWLPVGKMTKNIIALETALY